jgi:hypothetical protein
MYIDLFKSNEDIIEQYAAPADALDNATVYLAWYQYEQYSGSSLVVYEKGGKLYEVNGGHCSCNGLEGQWEPEETSWEALGMRNLHCPEAQKALAVLVHEHTKVKTSTIWIVNGTTGEYSDRTDWVVCAYHDNPKAEEHARNAMLRAKEIQKQHPGYTYHNWDENRVKNEFDPNMRLDYTGTEYYTVECILKD